MLPPAIAEQIERTIQGEARLDFGIDHEATTHGAIALMGTIGMTWGLRPDGSFWMFDKDFDVPLEALPSDCETQALVWGARRYPWLSALLPTRTEQALDCASCAGTGFLSVTWMCPRCHGLGWNHESRTVV
jgi:hypothetical protein